MTREEAKQLLPIIQAFAEGEIIECRTKPGTISAGIPNEWTEIKEIGFWNGIEYRIKLKPKYRPFKDAEECWTEMLNHHPFGWLNGDKCFYNIVTKYSSPWQQREGKRKRIWHKKDGYVQGVEG